MIKTSKIVAFEAFALYLLTGAACLVVGTSLTQLTESYNVSIAAVAGLGSAFAFGRMLTVFITGYLTKKLGVKLVFGVGTLFLMIFLIGLPLNTNYYIGLALSALGGVGMGSQDACCPVILSVSFPKHYSSALSAGQALFGAGCFLPPLLMSVAITFNMPFYYPYLFIAAIAAVMLILLPFLSIPSVEESAQLLEESGHAIQIGKKAKIVGFIILGVVCFTYCAILNTLNLYTATYAESLGIQSATAVTLLTIFNLGSMVGSFVFVKVLTRIKPVNALIINLIVVCGTLTLAIFSNNVPLLFVSVFATGLFIGVLFSILVSLATGLNPQNAALAGAIIAIVAASSDGVTPLITGYIVTNAGINLAYVYALLSAVACLVFAVIFKVIITKKQPLKGEK